MSIVRFLIALSGFIAVALGSWLPEVRRQDGPPAAAPGKEYRLVLIEMAG